MPKIVNCLWFDGQAQEAAEHYVSIFPDSRIVNRTAHLPDTPGTPGDVITVDFTLDGQPFVGLNGGPEFTFSEAISFQIMCADQSEVDHYWQRLAEGGEESQCGWLKDKFGVSWQVIPTVMLELLNDPDPERAQRATQAMLSMRRLVIDDLVKAADEVSA